MARRSICLVREGELGAVLEGHAGGLLDVDLVGDVVVRPVRGLDGQRRLGAQLLAEHQVDQVVLGLAVAVLGDDQPELAVGHAGLRLHHLHLGDHAHVVLGLGLVEQRPGGLEALLGHEHLLVGGDQVPVGVLDAGHDVHHVQAEGLERARRSRSC